MRALSLHADVVCVTSSVWATAAVLVRAPGERPESVLIDSPVLPVELDALGGLAEQAGFDVQGLLATHGDWDHLLGRLAFPGAALGADERTVQLLRAAPGAVQRELRDFDRRWYLQRERPLALGQVQPLPVPGRLDLGDQTIDVHDGSGHTGDGAIFWLPWAEVVIVGDYLSPLELPSWDGHGSRSTYAAALERIAPLVAGARWIVAGHGGPLSRDEALQLLDEDRDYLDGGDVPARGDATSRREQDEANRAAWDRAAAPLPSPAPVQPSPVVEVDPSSAAKPDAARTPDLDVRRHPGRSGAERES